MNPWILTFTLLHIVTSDLGLDDVSSAASNIINGVAETSSDAHNSAANGVSQTFTNIEGSATDALSSLENGANNIANGIPDAATNALQSVQSVDSGLGKGGSSGASDIFSSSYDSLSSVASAMPDIKGENVDSMLGSVVNNIANLTDINIADLNSIYGNLTDNMLGTTLNNTDSIFSTYNNISQDLFGAADTAMPNGIPSNNFTSTLQIYPEVASIFQHTVQDILNAIASNTSSDLSTSLNIILQNMSSEVESAIKSSLPGEFNETMETELQQALQNMTATLKDNLLTSGLNFSLNEQTNTTFDPLPNIPFTTLLPILNFSALSSTDMANSSTSILTLTTAIVPSISEEPSEQPLANPASTSPNETLGIGISSSNGLPQTNISQPFNNSSELTVQPNGSPTSLPLNNSTDGSPNNSSEISTQTNATIVTSDGTASIVTTTTTPESTTLITTPARTSSPGDLVNIPDFKPQDGCIITNVDPRTAVSSEAYQAKGRSDDCASLCGNETMFTCKAYTWAGPGTICVLHGRIDKADASIASTSTYNLTDVDCLQTNVSSIRKCVFAERGVRISLDINLTAYRKHKAQSIGFCQHMCSMDTLNECTSFAYDSSVSWYDGFNCLTFHRTLNQTQLSEGTLSLYENPCLLTSE